MCSITDGTNSRRESASVAAKEVKGLSFTDSVGESHRIDDSGDEGVSGFSKIKTLKLESRSQKWSTWRRIFFASKRVRSIMLLNLITMIYGQLLILFYFK